MITGALVILRTAGSQQCLLSSLVLALYRVARMLCGRMSIHRKERYQRPYPTSPWSLPSSRSASAAAGSELASRRHAPPAASSERIDRTRQQAARRRATRARPSSPRRYAECPSSATVTSSGIREFIHRASTRHSRPRSKRRIRWTNESRYRYRLRHRRRRRRRRRPRR